jgi:hypothetical protein
MVMYSNQAFVDAEARYRRERLAQDWSPRRAGELDAAPAPRAHASFPAARTLRGMVRRHRHA